MAKDDSEEGLHKRVFVNRGLIERRRNELKEVDDDLETARNAYSRDFHKIEQLMLQSQRLAREMKELSDAADAAEEELKFREQERQKRQEQLARAERDAAIARQEKERDAAEAEARARAKADGKSYVPEVDPL